MKGGVVSFEDEPNKVLRYSKNSIVYVSYVEIGAKYNNSHAKNIIIHVNSFSIIASKVGD